MLTLRMVSLPLPRATTVTRTSEAEGSLTVVVTLTFPERTALTPNVGVPIRIPVM